MGRLILGLLLGIGLIFPGIELLRWLASKVLGVYPQMSLTDACLAMIPAPGHHPGPWLDEDDTGPLPPESGDDRVGCGNADRSGRPRPSATVLGPRG